VARKELRFINKTRKKHFGKPSYRYISYTGIKYAVQNYQWKSMEISATKQWDFPSDVMDMGYKRVTTPTVERDFGMMDVGT